VPLIGIAEPAWEMLIVPERVEASCCQVSVKVPELLPLYWPDHVPVSQPADAAVVVVIEDGRLIETGAFTEVATERAPDAWAVVDVAVVAAFLLLPQATVITEVASTTPMTGRTGAPYHPVSFPMLGHRGRRSRLCHKSLYDGASNRSLRGCSLRSQARDAFAPLAGL
jgi:hypothetical protein